MIRIGMITTIDPAMTWGHSVRYWNEKRCSPTGRVAMLLELAMKLGIIKESQLPWKVSTASVARAGRESGSARRQYMPKRDRPSILAASSISIGIDWKNWRIKKIPNAETMKGTVRPW